MIGRFPLNLIDPIQYQTLTTPAGIAYDAAGGRIAVVQVTPGTVVFLNATTLTVITTVTLTVHLSLNTVCFDAGGNRFFVSDDQGQISIISGVDYSVSSFVTLPASNPTCRAIRIADTRIFFSCFYTGTTTSKIYVYNLSSAALITSFSVNNITGMEIYGGKIYAACHGANNVLVYDLTSYAFLSTITVGVDCFTITNDPDSDYMIIQSRDGNQLKLLTKSTGSITGGFAGITGPIDSVFINGKIYVTLQSAGKLAVVEKFYS
jgi:DNA-binding beta-propeller fold protein YncE